MTSATTWIDGSPRIVAKSSVRTPGSAVNDRSLAGSRTSARVTRSLWPVERSISSADSSSSRCTAAPTVPYPSSATGTSTDAASTGLLPLAGPVHQPPQLLADRLELGLRSLGSHRLQARLVIVHVRDPLAGELAGLDVVEDSLHLLAHPVVDHALPARVVAELGCVGDRVAHSREPVLVHEIDDQLQLVEALVVGDLRRVAGLDERLEACADELGGAAAEHRLLTEEVGLGLLLERRLEDAGAAGADADGVGERELARVAGGVLLDGDEGRRAVALGEEPADDVPRALRRDHDHVMPGGRGDPLVEDVEAVGEEHGCARREIRLDVLVEHLRLHLVGQQDRDELRAGDRVGDRADGETRGLGLSP